MLRFWSVESLKLRLDAGRHQDPVMVDDGIKITEEEFDARSKANVEHWVSAHIIPVCFIFIRYFMHKAIQHPFLRSNRPSPSLQHRNSRRSNQDASLPFLLPFQRKSMIWRSRHGSK